MNLNKQKVLVISHVSPFDQKAGQNLRVAYTLQSLKRKFEVHLLTYKTKTSDEEINKFCDKLIVVPRDYNQNILRKIYHYSRSILFRLRTGLRHSNYIIGELEFREKKISLLLNLDEDRYKFVLFEYWHTHRLSNYFRNRGIYTICDTHNVLWQTYATRMKSSILPKIFYRNYLAKYKRYEEEVALKVFDKLVAINETEYRYFKKLYGSQNVFLCPMGIDITQWDYRWKLTEKRVLGYYGGLNSPHNERAAYFIATEVYPILKKKYPQLNLKIIGSKPSPRLIDLNNKTDITVTGFIAEPAAVLKECTLVLIPWEGKYGFRSRIIEMLSVGVPTLTSSDAIDGMDLKSEEHLFLINSTEPKKWSKKVDFIFQNTNSLDEISIRARKKVETDFSKENTYDKLTSKLLTL